MEFSDLHINLLQMHYTVFNITYAHCSDKNPIATIMGCSHYRGLDARKLAFGVLILTKFGSNQTDQLQRLARILKFSK